MLLRQAPALAPQPRETRILGRTRPLTKPSAQVTKTRALPRSPGGLPSRLQVMASLEGASLENAINMGWDPQDIMSDASSEEEGVSKLRESRILGRAAKR